MSVTSISREHVMWGLVVRSFFNRIFEDQFHLCLEFPAQTRYIIAFPLICSHFMNCTHELCPEEVSDARKPSVDAREYCAANILADRHCALTVVSLCTFLALQRHHIGDRSLTMVNAFLDEMSKEAKNIITTICDEQCTLSDRLLPKHVAPQIAHVVNKKKREKKPRALLANAIAREPRVTAGRARSCSRELAGNVSSVSRVFCVGVCKKALVRLCRSVSPAGQCLLPSAT